MVDNGQRVDRLLVTSLHPITIPPFPGRGRIILERGILLLKKTLILAAIMISIHMSTGDLIGHHLPHTSGGVIRGGGHR